MQDVDYQPDRRWVLHLNERQAYLIRNVTEYFSRIVGGQLGELYDMLEWHVSGELQDIPYPKRNLPTKWGNEWKEIEEKIRKIFFPDLSPGSSYGIGNDKLDEDSKIAWDIYQVIRQPLYKKATYGRSKDWGCVLGDDPMKFSKCNLAKFEEEAQNHDNVPVSENSIRETNVDNQITEKKEKKMENIRVIQCCRNCAYCVINSDSGELHCELKNTKRPVWSLLNKVEDCRICDSWTKITTKKMAKKKSKR